MSFHSLRSQRNKTPSNANECAENYANQRLGVRTPPVDIGENTVTLQKNVQIKIEKKRAEIEMNAHTHRKRKRERGVETEVQADEKSTNKSFCISFVLKSELCKQMPPHYANK